MNKNSNGKPWNNIETKTEKSDAIPGAAASVAGAVVLRLCPNRSTRGGQPDPLDLPSNDPFPLCIKIEERNKKGN